MNILSNMSNWLIAAQVLGLITICFEFMSYQIKDKAKYFLCTGVGSLFWVFMFVCVGIATGIDTQLPVIIAAGYSTIRNFVFHYTFTKNTVATNEAGLIFLLVMIGFALIAGVITVVNSPEQVRWLHGLGLAAGIGFVVGQYLPGVHYVRITVVIYAIAVILTQTPINILYGDFRWNIMGILIETAKIASVVVFYVRYSFEPKKPALQFAKP